MSQKIFFIGINTVTLPLVDYVSTKSEVHVSNVSHIKSSESTYTYHNTPHVFFGATTLVGKVFNSQVSLPFYQKGLGRILKQVQPDVIVCMDFFRFWFLQALWYKFRNPNVRLIIHSETKISPKSALSKILFYPMMWKTRFYRNYIHSAIAYCDLGKKYLEKHLQIHTSVCPLPVDTSLFTPGDRDVHAPSGEIRVLMVSRFVPYKRHLDVIHAIKTLVTNGVSVMANFIGELNEYSEVLSREIIASDLQNHIKIVSAKGKDQLIEAYRKHDVLVLSSYNDAIGIVVPEALACGTPCVVSDTSGAAVYIQEGKNGYVYQTGDIEALAVVLQSFATADKAQLSAQARMSMETDFAATKLCLNFYEAISR